MQYPGPTLIVNQGDAGHRHPHQRAAGAGLDRLPRPDWRDAPPAASPGLLTREAPPDRRDTVTYTFTADRTRAPTTYHSGTQPDLQVEMGLVGALIVRPGRVRPDELPSGLRPRRTPPTTTSTCSC